MERASVDHAMKQEHPDRTRESFLPSADLPINDPKHDRLDRNEFAASVARTIRNRMQKDSFAFALYGSWGSGKTSLANLVLAHLNRGVSEGERIPVVKFNPWLCTDVQQMASLLFLEIGRVAVRAGPQEDAEHRSAIWEKYRAFLSVASSSVAATAATLELFEVPFAKLLKTIAEAGEKAAKLPEEAELAAKEQAQHRTQGLFDIKTELTNQLNSLSAPILIIIDDIDRLRAAEVTRIFQLIKANGDFPNIIYLLLFQRDIVERNLDEHSPGTGAEFLKKIVQEGLDIPPIRPEHIKRLLSEECRRILKGAWPELEAELLGGQDPGCYFYRNTGPREAVLTYFKTLRDVWRFLNGLDFCARLLETKELEGPIVHGADLFALEVMKLFEPAVYQELAANRKWLHPGGEEWEFGQVQDHYAKVQKSILDLASPGKRNQVATVLRFLYPHFGWEYAQQAPYEPNVGDKYGARLVHPDCSARFFEFRVDAIDAAIVKGLRSLRQARTDRANVKQQILKLQEELRLTPVILALTREIQQGSHNESLDQLILGLCDAGDELPKIRTAEHPVYDLIVACLDQTTPTVGKLIDAIRISEGLCAPCMLASGSVIRGPRPPEKSSSVLFEENDFKSLKAACLARLETAGNDGTLLRSPHFDWLALLWMQWGDERTVKDCVARTINTNDAAVWGLLKSCVVSYSERKETGADVRGMDLNYVKDLDALALLEKRLQAYDDQTLTRSQKELIALFFQTLNGVGPA